MTSKFESTILLSHTSEKSAFTPVTQKPNLIKPAFGIFDASPISKMFVFQNLCSQYSNDTLKKLYSPSKITPSQLLKVQPTPNLQRLNSCSFNNMFTQASGTCNSFSLETVIPSNSVLAKSPLRDHAELGYGSDTERDCDSTQNSSTCKSTKELTSSFSKKSPIVVNGVVVDKYMFSDNLNECVAFLLSKEKISTENVKAIIRHNSSAKSKEKRRRFRKNRDQHLILLNQYKKNPNWEKNIIQRLSDQLGLSESQIYKWNWDMRKKDGLQ